jgi:23S rRNA (adenine2503-C2)-methyltransferase
VTLALQGMTPAALARELELPLGDARKLVSAVHRAPPDEGLPFKPGTYFPQVKRTSVERVCQKGHLPSLTVVREQASAIDPFRKFLLQAPDGQKFETVRIPLEHPGRFSVCVSSQVGCALGCTFCATGRLGLLRNLETWEIVEQVRTVRRTLAAGEKVHGIVFQGMGEPLANFERVAEAIRVFCDPSAQAIDARAMTVCTSGLPTGIRRLGKELPKVRLGLSLGSALGATRRSLMPIQASHPLEEVIDACVEHVQRTGLAPMWAVTLLSGVNDGEEHAHALAALVRSFTEKSGKRPRISIIPYNAIDEGASDPFQRADDAREAAFRESLAQRGVFTHKRYSGGGDVAAACGQLSAKA